MHFLHHDICRAHSVKPSGWMCITWPACWSVPICTSCKLNRDPGKPCPHTLVYFSRFGPFCSNEEKSSLQFVSFLFQHDNALVHKAAPERNDFSQFAVEELDCPAQSPDLNHIQRLWDGLDCEADLNSKHQCWISLRPRSDQLYTIWQTAAVADQLCAGVHS